MAQRAAATVTKVISMVLHANCDAAAARVTRHEAPVAHPNFVLATTIMLGAIGRSLSADTGALQALNAATAQAAAPAIIAAMERGQQCRSVRSQNGSEQGGRDRGRLMGPSRWPARLAFAADPLQPPGRGRHWRGSPNVRLQIQ
jgi:hypothetical protein